MERRAASAAHRRRRRQAGVILSVSIVELSNAAMNGATGEAGDLEMVSSGRTSRGSEDAFGGTSGRLPSPFTLANWGSGRGAPAQGGSAQTVSAGGLSRREAVVQQPRAVAVHVPEPAQRGPRVR